MDKQMATYQKKLKDNIKQLVNENKLEDAKDLLDQYEEIVEDDIDIYSIKGVIAIMEGDMDEAERILREGLKIEAFNTDILYNLGYVSETTNKKEQAIGFYKQIFQNTDNEEVRNEVYEVLQKLGVRESREEIIQDSMVNKEKINILGKNILENKKVVPITIMTKVYNSINYIEQCVESVLNQSFTNFEWIILDNGCTDGTGEILASYAKKDKRIKLFKSKLNNIIYKLPDDPAFSEYLYNVESDYMCSLDSDDFLHRDFLEILYKKARKYDADVVVAGTEMFLDEDPKIRENRCPPNFYTRDKTEMGDIFPQIYGSFRPVWGKLVRGAIYIEARKSIVNSPTRVLNGADTMICLEILANSNSLVGVDKRLYYYRIRKSSIYHSHVDKYRYLDYVRIYEKSISLLQSWDKFNDINKAFIGEVLYYSIRDCIRIVTHADDLNTLDRIDAVNKILSDLSLIRIMSVTGLLADLLVDISESIDSLIGGEKEN